MSELESYHPDDYVREIRLAERLGYRVLIVDSLSHAWNGPGGLLEWKDQVARARYNNHGGAAWSEATPKQNRLVYTLTHARVHIIATMRTKIDYLFEKNKDGETVMTKVGLAPIQRDEFEYEFDIVGVMNRYHQMTIDGSRCSALDHCVIEKPGTEEASLDMAVLLLDWLHGSKPDQHTLLMEDLLFRMDMFTGDKSMWFGSQLSGAGRSIRAQLRIPWACQQSTANCSLR